MSKLERGHAKDLGDVEAMARLGLIESAELPRLFDEIEPELYRYPAIDPASFRSTVEELVRKWQRDEMDGAARLFLSPSRHTA